MSREKAARAGAWSALDIVLRQGVQFVVSIILARLLAPAAFGLIALLAFFTSLSITFVQGGLTQALVRHQDSTHEEESAVFWCNFAAALAFTAILVLLAPWLARFYEEPLLAPLILVAAAQIVLSSLGAVQTALLTRTLRFDQLTKTGIISSLLSGGAGVAAAVYGLGVWALAIQLLVMAGVSTLTLWWVSDWRPALRFRLSSISHLFRFGWYLSLSSVLEVVYSNGFALIIGKFYGVRDLGLLSRAHGIQILPTGIISTVISRTTLPLFAARIGDPEALRRALRASLRLAMFLSMPMLAGLSALSDLVVMTLFGPKWMDAAPLLRVLAVGGILLPLHVLNLQVLLAQGNSKLFLKLEIQKKLIGIACLTLGSVFGIIGFVYASVVFSGIAFALNARPTAASLAYGPLKQLWDLRGVSAATVFMIVVVLLLKPLMALPPAASLAVLVFAGASAYAAFGFVFRLEAFQEAVATTKLFVPKRNLNTSGKT